MSLRPQPARPVPEATAQVARAAFPRGCLAMRVRDELGALFEDAQFAEAFSARGGPGLSPGMLALVSVLAFAENLTDRQAADAVRDKISWKYALALELTDPGFDFSVLSQFRDRLIEHGLERRLLDELLARCQEAGLLSGGGRQRTDSTHIVASARMLNRMEFVGETLRAALEALAAAAPDWMAAVVAPEWIERYGVRVDGYRFPKGADARTRWALTVGVDGFALLEAVHAADAPAWLRRIPAVDTLRLAWIQQYHRDEKGVRWREGKDLPPGKIRLATPYDVDARYGEKRGSGWVGYKVHLSETCDPGAPHLITHVATTDAAVGDVEMIETIHRELDRLGLRPGEHVVDSGYLSIALLVGARDERGIDLVGPLGVDTSWQAATGLGQDAFSVDWLAKTATCPQGATSISWSEQRKPSGTPIIQVHFDTRDCGPCPLRERCTKAAGHRYGRSLTLLARPLQQALEQERQTQRTEEWKRRYDMRAGVEGTISQAVRTGQIRTTRYRGLSKTRLAHVLTASALNLIRLDAWWTNTPIRGTRASHLARLGASLGLAA
jgi:transposase